MPITNPAAIQMAIPQYQFDKIIGILTGSFVAASGSVTTTNSQLTGFNDSCYFQGIYSVDSGTTWNDFGSDIADATVGLNALDVTGQSSGNVFSVVAFNINTTTYNIQYKVALIAKNNQGFITPIPTSEILYYESTQNYPKIYLPGTVIYTTTSGVQFSSIVSHNLGYIPKVSAWMENFIGAGIISSIGGIAPTIQIDTSNVTFFTDAFLATSQSSLINYRIYLDNAS